MFVCLLEYLPKLPCVLRLELQPILLWVGVGKKQWNPTRPTNLADPLARLLAYIRTDTDTDTDILNIRIMDG